MFTHACCFSAVFSRKRLDAVLDDTLRIEFRQLQQTCRSQLDCLAWHEPDELAIFNLHALGGGEASNFLIYDVRRRLLEIGEVHRDLDQVAGNKWQAESFYGGKTAGAGADALSDRLCKVEIAAFQV